MLVVATSGAVATIMGVLLQTIDAIVCWHVGGVTHESCGMVGILLGQYDFLAPVTSDVAHESRTRASAAFCLPTALVGKFHQSGLVQNLSDHQVGAPTTAARRRQLLTLEVTIPPHTLKHGRDARA